MTLARTRSRSAAGALLLVLALALPAGAVDRSAEEFVDLAGTARLDPAALAELEATTSVDGQPIDIDWVVGDDEVRLDRLTTLSAETTSATRSEAADLAKEILSEPRFGDAGQLPASSALMAWAIRWTGTLLRWLEQTVPGSLSVLGWVVTLTVFGAAAYFGFTLLRRRERALEAAVAAAAAPDDQRPGVLERAAADAERRGDLDEAVRLLFKAALLRLDARGALEFHEGMTSGQVTERVEHLLVPGLVGTHDEVVYGERAATPADTSQARDGWQRVVRETR